MVNNLPLWGWGILCQCCSALWLIAICSLVNLTQERAFWRPPSTHTHTHPQVWSDKTVCLCQKSILSTLLWQPSPVALPWPLEPWELWLLPICVETLQPSWSHAASAASCGRERKTGPELRFYFKQAWERKRLRGSCFEETSATSDVLLSPDATWEYSLSFLSGTCKDTYPSSSCGTDSSRGEILMS